MGRLDLNIKTGWTFFAKFTYDQNFSVRGFNPGVYQPFENVDHTPDYAVGTDFTSGKFTHSIRFGYLKFRNGIVMRLPAFSIRRRESPSTSRRLRVDVTCLGRRRRVLLGHEHSGSAEYLPERQASEVRRQLYDWQPRHSLRRRLQQDSWRRVRQVLRRSTRRFLRSKTPADEAFAARQPIRAGRRDQSAELASQHGHHGQRPGFLHGNPAVRASGRRTV